MSMVFEPSLAKGTVTAPPSKSMAHRFLILAAMADGRSVIENVSFSEDILATIDCIEAIGAKVNIEGSKVTVDGKHYFRDDAPEFKCRESGSTLRFFIPITFNYASKAKYYGSERLLERPLSVYEKLINENGGRLYKDGDHISYEGDVDFNDVTVPGNISSQFITGLMFYYALKPGTYRIHITDGLESRPYILMTMDAFRKFGIETDFEDVDTIYVKGGRIYPAKLSVEGDYSNAAFLDAFNLAGGKVDVKGLSSDSVQGDRIYRKFFNELFSAEHPVFDIKDCPDLGPVLMAVMAIRKGGRLTGTERLKIKESDRGVAMAEELNKFGIKAHVSENHIDIEEGKLLRPSTPVWGHNDHRIAMSLSVLLSITGGTLEGENAVNKSFPDFFEIIKTLGVKFQNEQ
ncbi:MAG: 3-phosphoshikimate 1-carboxyvinyltransferase [Lachnospiraceae bacterium]|nr:3-phosphoshikimate 1-carboxyvinyltransferase [Lachnospiraceae bacterium]